MTVGLLDEGGNERSAMLIIMASSCQEVEPAKRLEQLLDGVRQDDGMMVWVKRFACLR